MKVKAVLNLIKLALLTMLSWFGNSVLYPLWIRWNTMLTKRRSRLKMFLPLVFLAVVPLAASMASAPGQNDSYLLMSLGFLAWYAFLLTRKGNLK